MSCKLSGSMNFKIFKILIQNMKQAQILNNYSINGSINQFIQQADECRDFTFNNNNINSYKDFAIVIRGQFLKLLSNCRD